MTSNETMSTTDEIVVIPAVTVPVSFPDDVAEARRQLEGLIAFAERVYVDLLPQAQKGDHAPDSLHQHFGDVTGWADLMSAMMDVAGAFLVAAGTHEGDIGWFPDFITDEDKVRRNKREADRMLEATRPEKVAEARKIALELVAYAEKRTA